MSRLTELIRQAKEKDPTLGAELEREYRTLAGRRAFGLNFERHRPEAVELPGRPVRRGDKVRVLPERGSTDRGDQRLWRVARIEKVDGQRHAHLVVLDGSEETASSAVDDLVVVAEFRDPIHPGLVPTGAVSRGGDKPAHTVINGENFHVLKALTYTHRGKVDAIYIDPPYNTGAKDWKYNNDYVEGDDLYRHSKWLAFMERRLLLAKELLNPEGSVLIVTIDEKEYLRLGLLLEQVFPGEPVQSVSITINPKGRVRPDRFTRVDEFAFFVSIGDVPIPNRPGTGGAEEVRWPYLRRSDMGSVRGTRPRQFYPIYVDSSTGKIAQIGPPIAADVPRSAAPSIPGCIAVFPVRDDGLEMEWGLTGPTLREALAEGFVRVTAGRSEHQPYTISYLTGPSREKVRSGELTVQGVRADGSKVVVAPEGKAVRQTTVWTDVAHDAGAHGTSLLGALIPRRQFPFPKSLYAVEDSLRFFVGEKLDAVVLDFFAGSGTTAHAVMRLNRQDGGRRQCISVTNNEVSADEQKRLRASGLRPGDPEWEALGICDFITKPRIEAAITGRSPDGEPIKGDYKFTDEFPMADGFEENAEFFTLTYENPVAIGHNRAFERVAPLLWLRAGAQGHRIDAVPPEGWGLADTYGILFDLDRASEFAEAVGTGDGVRLVFVVTDDDRRFQSVARQVPDGVEVMRLYESYLSNFRFTGGES